MKEIIAALAIAGFVSTSLASKENHMTNVKAEVKGNILTLTVDLTERHGRSASGKTEIIGTTAGNKQVVHNGKMVSYGLNVYTKE